MSRSGQSQRDGQQCNARPPPAARPLHCVGDTHRRVHETVEPPHGKHFIVGCDRIAYDRWTETIQPECEETAFVAKEPTRDPPESASEPDSEEDKRQVQQ